MCGIFGYYNFNCPKDRKYVLDMLFTGLRRLEYRGYDSAGICIDGDALTSAPVRAILAAKPSTNGNSNSPRISKLLNEHSVVENGQLLSPMEYLGTDGMMKPIEPKVPLVIKSVGKIDELVKQAEAELAEGQVRLLLLPINPAVELPSCPLRFQPWTCASNHCPSFNCRLK